MTLHSHDMCQDSQSPAIVVALSPFLGPPPTPIPPHHPPQPNTQVFQSADDNQSFFEYDNEELDLSMGSYLHDVGEVEYKGIWARFR